MLADYYAGAPFVADLIVPVPLHPRRLRERGYNQAALLAHQLGSAAQIAVRCDVLRRHRYTRSQTHLNAEQRNQNVQGAFSWVERRDTLRALSGKQVLLVDDVTTTGATLRACAQVLRERDVRAIWALTVARAAPHLS
jgi:ComF family protein